MPHFQPYSSKRIGELLIEANLLAPAQVQVALYDQQQFSTLRLGEIIVFRGWLNQQTVDFFGDRWLTVCSQKAHRRRSIGEYLCAAGLMDRYRIEQTVQEQHRNGYRFGANAVLLGFIKQQTLDYFLTNLFPEQKDAAHYMLHPEQKRARTTRPAVTKTTAASRDGVEGVLRVKQDKSVKPRHQAGDDEVSWVG